MRIVVVGYLNTLPFIQGLEKEEIELIKAHPADCAEMLHNGEADIGLIPVGALENDRTYYYHKEYGIACNGEVRTVCLFGETPVEDWDKVILDYQSRTSVLLSQLLLKEYWDKELPIINGYPGYEEDIEGNTGGLIIGDRVFDYENSFSYQYDLGKTWKDWTGLPFVFAVWVSLNKIKPANKEKLMNALEYGIENFEIPSSMVNLPLQANEYYRNNIEYVLDSAKQKSLQIFLHKIGKSNLKLLEL